MQLHHEFSLPIPPEQAWGVLRDVPRVARCMPGATLDRADGDEFSGRVSLKVGPLRMSYLGDLRITEKDDTSRRLVINGVGKEARGSGTAEATVTAALCPDGDGTLVALDTDLGLTGRAAQFGSGLVSEVAGNVIGQFAERLSHEMRSGEAPARDLPPAPTAPTEPVATERAAMPASSAPAAGDGSPSAEPAENSLDVLALAKPLLGSRGAVTLGAIAGLALAFLLGRRGRKAQQPTQPWIVPVLLDSERK